MKAARMLGATLLLSAAACSSSDPSDAGAVPARPTTTTTQPSTTQPPTTVGPSTSTTRPAGVTTVTAPRPSTTSTVEPAWTKFTSLTYGISLAYPPDWSAPSEDGATRPNFFTVGAYSGGGQSLATSCRGEAAHRLRPFGAAPTVRDNVSFAGQPACIIEPSPDQPEENRGMAQLMVRYPTPVQLPTGRYEVFVLTAHVRHLSAIAATLSFPT